MSGFTKKNRMKLNYSSIIKIISLYQLLVWIVALYYFMTVLYSSIFIDNDLTSVFILLIFIYLSVWLIFSNFCLLFKLRSNHYKKYLVLNFWSNFFQIFQLSLLGFNYLFAFGVYIVLGYSDQANQVFLSTKLFQTLIALNYTPSNLIRCGVNVIPLIIFIVLNKIIKDLDGKNK